MMRTLWSLLREAATIYWVLVKTVLPVMVLTRVAVELGVIDLLAPVFTPLMALMGLPPELGFAWATCLMVGIWAGAAAAFTVVPVETLTTAQVTIFAALMLIAHTLPIEQQIARKAGPGFFATSVLRLVGAIAYSTILNQIYRSAGWLDEPATPLWVPATTDPGWTAFAWTTAESLVWMFVILAGLMLLLRILEAVGITRGLTVLLAPVLRVAGISPSATPLTMVGLLLGLSYGGGLIIREARQGHLSARDIFLSIALMGFAHSLIEDTLVVVSFGADLTSVLLGRVVFSLIVVGVLASIVTRLPDDVFFRFLFNQPASPSRDPRAAKA